MREGAWQYPCEVEARGFSLGLAEGFRAARGIGRGHAACPPVRQHHVTGIEQVIVAGGAQFVGIAGRTLQHIHRQSAPFGGLGTQRRDEFGQRFIAFMCLREGVDLRQEHLQAGALAAGGLATDQVQRLDAGGAFVQRGDAGIAGQLFHAVFADVAMAAETLQRVVGILDTPFGLAGLGDGRQEAHQGIGAFTLGRVLRAVRDVDQGGGVQGQQAAAFHQRSDGQQHAPHIRMDQDRIGRLFRELRAAQRARLQTLARIGQGVLVGALGQADALQAHAQARRVHHGEHCLQALVRLTDQIAFRRIEVHHAGDRALDAHLVLDGTAAQAVALALVAIAVHLEFRGDEQRDSLRAGRCVGQSRQHQMHDVAGQVVLAGGDEDLGAGDGVAAVRIRLGLCLQQPQVGAAMRLGQAHGAGPASFDERLQEGFVLPRFAMLLQRLDGAVGQQRKVAPGQVCRVDHLVQRHAQGMRQALPTDLRRGGQAGPAAFHELFVGLLETGRRGHLAAGLVEHAADFIAHAVQRRQHAGTEAPGFFQHGIHHIGGGVGEPQAGEQLFHLQDIVQGEAEVGKRGGVAAHREASRSGGRPRCGARGSQRSTPGRPGAWLSVLRFLIWKVRCFCSSGVALTEPSSV